MSGDYPHDALGLVAKARQQNQWRLDEPLPNLDAQLRVRMREEVSAIQRRVGIATVFVTHDQEAAFSIADRIAVMQDGVLEQSATPSELYARPATRFVATFIGTMNRPYCHGVNRSARSRAYEKGVTAGIASPQRLIERVSDSSMWHLGIPAISPTTSGRSSLP